MKFLGVSSAGFGAIRNRSLTFAPKFTVIYGPNEAGKSTWHAALYAAFCGMRRSRVQSRADEEFIQQYRPWNPSDPWEVRVRFMLQDGRNIELRQELSDRLDCHAVDVNFGRDYSNEIINEGSPDGAKWLGLDRRSFLATACVKQTQLLDVLNNPDVLHQHLQRAAATCAVNSNGAKALQLIESFRSEFVGDDKFNSTRPLARALRRLDSVKGSLSVARNEHERYLHLMASENLGKARLDNLRRELNLARAIVADRDANDWDRRLQRVLAILSSFPQRPSGDLELMNSLVLQVSTALRIWQERPDLLDLSGLTSEEITAQIAALPAPPEGDLEPDPTVLRAEGEYLAAKYALTLHVQAEPSQAVFPETGGMSVDELRQFTKSLQEPEPEGDPRLDEIARNPINDRLIQRVHTAIEVWERRPKPAEVSRPTGEEIRRVIETLPAPVDGEIEPAHEIMEAANSFSSAKEALRQHALDRPGEPVYPNLVGTTPAELRTLALRLKEPGGMTGFSKKIRVRSAAKKELEQLGKTRTMWISMAGGLGLLALIPLAFFLGRQQPVIVGSGFAVLAVLVSLVAKWKAAPINAKRKELENMAGEAETEGGSEEQARMPKDVQDRIARLGLPSNSEAIEALADELEAAQDAERMGRMWKDADRRLEKSINAAASKLQALLGEKIEGEIRDVEEAFAHYQRECVERAHTAALAGRRMDLERQLAAKMEAEVSASEINARRESAEVELRQVAKACKLAGENDAELVKKLNAWLNECERLKTLQSELGQKAMVRVAWKQRQLERREQLLEKNLPVEPTALKKLAEELDQALAIKAAYERWSSIVTKLTQQYELRASQLQALLENKDIEMSADLEQVLQRYREVCEARSVIAAEANRRGDLERQLASRKQLEDAAAQIETQRLNAHQELITVATNCGVAQAEEVQLAESLREWLKATSEEIRVQTEGLKEWRELDTLLEGRMVDEFKEKVQQHRDNALVLGSAFSSEELAEAIQNLQQYEENIAKLAVQVDSAAQELANIQGQIRAYEDRPVSVSDAEEELRTAEEELANVRQLDDTLETTHVFLSSAQEKVHRDIAPFLAEIVRRWLPEITLGRYVDVRVDSSTLQIEVCDQSGEWRDAMRLSHGTAEQIYLLLRLAMVEYLTKPGEVCPIILDDITLQSDARRKERILETLKKVSEKRQVVLFTQEEEVLLWARRNLTEPEGRIIELMPAAV